MMHVHYSCKYIHHSCPSQLHQFTPHHHHPDLNLGDRRASADAASVLVVVDAVELDLDVLDLPRLLLLVERALEDGDAADGQGRATGDLSEGGGPDEGDLLAVPGADLDNDQGDVVGLGRGMLARENQRGMRKGRHSRWCSGSRRRRSCWGRWGSRSGGRRRC